MYIIISLIIISLILFSYTDTDQTLLGKSYFSSTNKIIPSSGILVNVSGTYTLPDIGFIITLPIGWKGIDLWGTTLVSPTGINPTTGVLNPSSNLEKVFLILTRSNTSHTGTSTKADALSNDDQYSRESAKSTGCKVMSDKFVMLNGIRSEEVVGRCGILEDVKFLAYAIASNENIVYVGLKGPIPAFEYNYPIFIQSINTMKINNQTDINSFLR
jgi:hypothetical protein